MLQDDWRPGAHGAPGPRQWVSCMLARAACATSHSPPATRALPAPPPLSAATLRSAMQLEQAQRFLIPKLPPPHSLSCLCPQVATLRSAVKLEQEQQFLIAKKLQELTGSKNIKLRPLVDAR